MAPGNTLCGGKHATHDELLVVEAQGHAHGIWVLAPLEVDIVGSAQDCCVVRLRKVGTAAGQVQAGPAGAARFCAASDRRVPWYPIVSDAVASLTAKPCDPGRSQAATLLDCPKSGWLWQQGVHQSGRDVLTDVVSNVLLALAFMVCDCLQQGLQEPG